MTDRMAEALREIIYAWDDEDGDPEFTNIGAAIDRARATLAAPAPEGEVEAAAKAIYDAENGIDGDSIATMIHENFRIDPDDGNKGLDNTMAVCRIAAKAALGVARSQSVREGVIEECKQVAYRCVGNYWDRLDTINALDALKASPQ